MKKNKELVEFGLFFAKLREASGFRTKSELADASKVAISTISRIESGTNKVQPNTLKVLAPFLKGISYDELMKKAGYIGTNTEIGTEQSNLDLDDDIREIQRYARKLSAENRKRALKMIKVAFEDAFNKDDEDNEEDDDI
ncbi:MAG TPA: helix-turn-helix transcriptional regulator [Bacillota bacterium]|nr:helix-turn-helix transcriptional regulator [Bacillota bacterium]